VWDMREMVGTEGAEDGTRAGVGHAMGREAPSVTEEDPLGPEYFHTYLYTVHTLTLYSMESSVKSRKKPVLASLRP
jgi:hypothetical protein